MFWGVKWQNITVYYPANLQSLFKEIIKGAKLPPLNKDELFAIELCFVEAMNNAFIHGNKRDSQKKVVIEYRFDGKAFEMRITDEGSGFDGASVPDPLEEENITKDSGRGLLLMSHYMDDIYYNAKGNQVYMKKLIGAG